MCWKTTIICCDITKNVRNIANLYRNIMKKCANTTKMFCDIRKKKVKYNKNNCFCMFLKCWDMRNQHFFPIKNHEKNMPAIQTCFMMLQMTEHNKNLSKIVSRGDPKSIKTRRINPGTFLVPLCASVTHLIAKCWRNVAQGPPNGS